MRNLPVSFTEEALADLNGFFDYVLYVSRSPNIAGKYIDRLIRFCEATGFLPRIGLPIRLNERDLRRRVFEKTLLIIYEMKDDRVDILRIVSGRPVKNKNDVMRP